MKIKVYYDSAKVISVDNKFEKLTKEETPDKEWAELANELWEELDKELSKEDSAFCYCTAVETLDGETLMEL